MPENEHKKDEKKKKGRKKRDLVRVNSLLSDGELCTKSRVWCSLLQDHLAAFSALDPAFNAAYCTAWLSAIEALEQLPTAEVKADEQVTARVVVERNRSAFFVLVDALQFYVSRAYPGQPYKAAEFGLTRIRSQANKRGVRDVVLGFAMGICIDNNLPALLAAGMPPAFKTDFDNALGHYADAEVKHQYSLLNSVKATNERVKAFNDLYALHRHVSEAADVVFAGNAVMADLWR